MTTYLYKDDKTRQAVRKAWDAAGNRLADGADGIKKEFSKKDVEAEEGEPAILKVEEVGEGKAIQKEPAAAVTLQTDLESRLNEHPKGKESPT